MVKLVEDDGWYVVHKRGTHWQFKHSTKRGRVTIPHPKKDLTIRTVDSILKQAGLK
ncbi:type II toxin-antitoxin system HicA family toxin [Paenibacillus sp. YIM B09110]|uniref:type II toxin-antitoxin system HicA family toxin n=1 Tax=Paenibacillus sp. YIM B09110 TaxID=3126102 RepID=UPI00301CA4F0